MNFHQILFVTCSQERSCHTCDTLVNISDRSSVFLIVSVMLWCRRAQVELAGKVWWKTGDLMATRVWRSCSHMLLQRARSPSIQQYLYVEIVGYVILPVITATVCCGELALYVCIKCFIL